MFRRKNEATYAVGSIKESVTLSADECASGGNNSKQRGQVILNPDEVTGIASSRERLRANTVPSWERGYFKRADNGNVGSDDRAVA